MNIKIIPTNLEIDIKNPETPLKVHYVVELATDAYNDIMSSGVTYISDPTVQSAIENLTQKITDKINLDLGLQSVKIKPQDTEEEL